MKQVVAIIKPFKLDEVREALAEIGVQGMTVSQVYGCGLQKGHTEVYRGKQYSVNLVPKVKIETIVCAVPVELVLETARKALQTGHIGDGKIFVYDVENAMRIRTGTMGDKAITDDEA